MKESSYDIYVKYGEAAAIEHLEKLSEELLSNPSKFMDILDLYNKRH